MGEAVNDSASIIGWTMGTHRALAAGKARRSWAIRRRQSAIRRCGCLDGANGSALARPAAVLRQVEQRLETLSSLGQGGDMGTILAALADDPDFESVIIDGTVIRAHQHAAGGKGGFKNKRSDGRVED